MARRHITHSDMQHPETLPPYLTATDVSNILCCARSLIYELLAAGELPSIRLGRTIRIRTTDLLERLDRNCDSSRVKSVSYGR